MRNPRATLLSDRRGVRRSRLWFLACRRKYQRHSPIKRTIKSSLEQSNSAANALGSSRRGDLGCWFRQLAETIAEFELRRILCALPATAGLAACTPSRKWCLPSLAGYARRSRVSPLRSGVRLARQLTSQRQPRRLSGVRVDANAYARIAWIWAGKPLLPFMPGCVKQPPITVVDCPFQSFDRFPFQRRGFDRGEVAAIAAHYYRK